MAQPLQLPTSPTSFVGRDRELAQAHNLLEATRLLTLTGAGGCGKTRLAIQLATDLRAVFADGVVWCDLVSIFDPAYVPRVVASVLQIAETSGQSTMDALADALAARELLIVLDNCEHLLGACTALVHTVLQKCPRVKIMATSLQALGLPQETAWLVPPLSLPDPQSAISSEPLGESDAVRLFVERAKQASPSFALNPQNAQAVVTICRRLDGLPLALELAAARLKMFSPAQIAERLDNAFDLLTRGLTDHLPRHQTLRATMDWSYQLLTETERALLRCLSVFASSFTLEMVEAICGDRPERASFDVLTDLVDKSLVSIHGHDANGVAGFRLLETVRQYAREKLEESGEAARVRNRLLDWFTGYVEKLESLLTGPHQGIWLDQLEANLDNLRSAMRWACTSQNIEQGLRLAKGLHHFWMTRDHLREGREWFEELLSLDDQLRAGDLSRAATAHTRAEALYSSGRIAVRQWDDRHAVRRGEEALRLFRALGDKSGIAKTLNALALAATDQHRYADAIAYHEEALALSRELKDDYQIAITLGNLGWPYAEQGDFARATALWEESVALLPRTTEAACVTLNNLGEIALRRGDDERAQHYFDECLAAAREVGSQFSVALALVGYGEIARNYGNLTQAEQYLNDALKLAQPLGFTSEISRAFAGLGDVARLRGEYERAQSFYEQSRQGFRRAEYARGVAHTTARLGLLELLKGNDERAATRTREALELAYDASALLECVITLEQLAGIVARQGDARRAARWLAFAAARRETMGANLPPAERAQYDLTVQLVRATLGDDAFAEIQAAARALTLEEIVADALRKARVEEKPAPALEPIREPKLRIYALGPTRVIAGERALTSADWKYTKAKELLFYLLMNPPATKAQIGLDLWPEASPAQLRNIFHRAMYHLRQALGKQDWIVFEDNVYAFNRELNYWSDFHQFESHLRATRDLGRLEALTSLQRAQAIQHLTATAQLWRGDFLDDLDAGEWAIVRREELRHAFLQAMLDLGALHFAEVQYQAALQVYQRILSFDNFLEVAHRQIMRCYARLAESSQSARHYQALRQLLRDEMHIEPSPETRLLYERIMRGDDV